VAAEDVTRRAPPACDTTSMKKRCAYLLPIAAIICTSGAMAQTVVTRAGDVRGVTSAVITSFKGIPYAAPPVGALRWKPPQPPLPWQDVRAADKTGPACMQPRDDLDSRVAVSEDCLYLNVWRSAAAQPGSKLPVMVYIHGGGFVGGTASDASRDGTNLARNGVIVVTLNYRLGRFGWFAYPELTAEAAGGATGNFGLMDQVAALHWVRDNIAAFGGDPARVTIFGESAGGISVNALMSVPAARGLFRAAITQSGLGRNSAAPLQAAEKMGAAFAKAAGASDLAALRNLPAETVLNTADDDPKAQPPGLILDGKLMQANIEQVFAKGAQAEVPWIVGSNNYEASLYADRVANPDATLAALPENVRSRAFALYDPLKTGSKGAVLALLLTDKNFTEPARFLARLHVRSGAPVYRYFFSYVPEKARGRVPGAAHGDELNYVFGQFNPDPKLKIKFTDADKRMAALVEGYWTNFARASDPNGWGLPPWPRDKRDDVLVLDWPGAHPARGFRKRELDFVAHDVPKL
jgi:para-nitrobenzyl esterase